LIIFSSDNGPWYQGNPGFNRGRKNQTWEGGQRVPFIVRWPGHVAETAVQSTPVSGVDIFPTLLALLNLPPPQDRIIDGMDVTSLLVGGAVLPDRPLFYFSQDGSSLDAVRDNRHKYHRRRGVRVSALTDNIDVLTARGPWLFDLTRDQQESYDVSLRFPEEMQRLEDIYKERVAEMESNPRGWLNTP